MSSDKHQGALPTPHLKTQLGQLFYADCLELLPKLVGQVSFDLIYTDPPFAAGGQRSARLKVGSRSQGELAYTDAWNSIGEWLNMFRPRLEAMAALLSPLGSLWVHLDHRAIHEAKCLCDEVLGSKNFQGEIIWVPGNGAKRRNGPSVTHQTIVIYAPSGKMIWNGSHPSLREPFAETSTRMHFKNQDAEGRRYRERVVNGKTYRYFEDEGRQIGSVWLDCPAMQANTPLTQETTGYPTQKPERLLERIIHAASNPGSYVLDPMCGSGTTLAVAERLGRRWVGADQSPVAIQVASKRLSQLSAAPPSSTKRPRPSQGKSAAPKA